METLDFASGSRPSMKIITESNKEIILTRKRVAVKDAESFDKEQEALNTLLADAEITQIEYSLRVIEHLCDGVEREHFSDMDIHNLIPIINAVKDMRMESAQKKTE